MVEENFDGGTVGNANGGEPSTPSSIFPKTIHNRNAILPCVLDDFLISTKTATTTVFILPIKQGRVTLRSSRRIHKVSRRKSRDGI
jgi:hypothetical protein